MSELYAAAHVPIDVELGGAFLAWRASRLDPMQALRIE
jgi:hypothetical protein